MTDDWERGCVLCARRGRKKLIDDGHLCIDCATRIVRNLSQILAFVADAPAFVELTRTGSAHKPSFASAPPLNVEALDPDRVDVPRWRPKEITDGGKKILGLTDPVRRDPDPVPLIDTLASWASMVADDRQESYGEPIPALHELTVIVAYLKRHMGWIINTPTFPVDDFADSVTDCLRVANRWNVAAAWGAWSVDCPNDTEHGLCGHRIEIKADDIDRDVTCRRCQRTWSVAWLMRVAVSPNAGHVWLDAESIGQRFGISARTLRQWANEGRINREHGLYDVSEFITRHTDTGT